MGIFISSFVYVIIIILLVASVKFTREFVVQEREGKSLRASTSPQNLIEWGARIMECTYCWSCLQSFSKEQGGWLYMLK